MGEAILARRCGGGSLNVPNGKISDCVAIEDIPKLAFVETCLTNIRDSEYFSNPCTISTSPTAPDSGYTFIGNTEKIINICDENAVYINVIDTDGTILNRTFVGSNSSMTAYMEVIQISDKFYAIAYPDGFNLKIAILSLTNDIPTLVSNAYIVLGTSNQYKAWHRGSSWEMKKMGENSFMLAGFKGAFIYQFDGNSTLSEVASADPTSSQEQMWNLRVIEMDNDIYALVGSVYASSDAYRPVVITFKATNNSVQMINSFEFDTSNDFSTVKINKNVLLLYSNSTSNMSLDHIRIDKEGTASVIGQRFNNTPKEYRNNPKCALLGSVIRIKDRILMIGRYSDPDTKETVYASLELSTSEDGVVDDIRFSNYVFLTGSLFPARLSSLRQTWQRFIETKEYILIPDSLKTLSKVNFVDLGIKLPKSTDGVHGIATKEAKAGQKGKFAELDV